MGWKALEKRQFPAPPKYVEMDTSSEEVGKLHTPGGGIIKTLYSKCEETQTPLVVMLMFASEGNNIPEAVSMFKSFNQAYKVIPELVGDAEYKTPSTWKTLLNSSIPDIY